MHASIIRSAKNAVPLYAVKAADLKRWIGSRSKREQDWLKAANFSAKEGELVLIPGAKGLAGAVLGLGKGSDKYALAQFSEQLPPGIYAFSDIVDGYGGANGTLAWILGTYVFGRYRKSGKREAKLVLPKGVDGEEASRIAEGILLARDLINTPSNDMGPEELAVAARAHGAWGAKLTGGGRGGCILVLTRDDGSAAEVAGALRAAGAAATWTTTVEATT